MKRIIGFIISLLAWIVFTSAQQIAVSNPLFSDHKARKVGDILTVEIIEFTEAQNESNNELEMTNQKSLGMSASLPDLTSIGLTGAMSGQGSFGSNLGSKFQGSGKSSNKGSLKGKMTVFIVKDLGNGQFKIEGTRDVVLNGEHQMMKLEGTVRARDITANNTIPSYKIANATITYSGKGSAASTNKPGILTRIFNWVF